MVDIESNLPEGDISEGDDVGNSGINTSGESSKDDDDGDIQPYMYVPLYYYSWFLDWQYL